MSSIRFKDETPSKVTTNKLDDPSDSDNDTEQEMEDSSSVEDQKVTAVVAVIDTSTEDPTNGIEHSRRCRRTKKLLFTKKIRVLLDTGSDGDIWFHSTGNELTIVIPIVIQFFRLLSHYYRKGITIGLLSACTFHMGTGMVLLSDCYRLFTSLMSKLDCYRITIVFSI